MFLHCLEDFLLASFKGQSMLKRVVQLMFSISIGFSASWVDHINDNSALARQPLFQRCQEIALWVFRSCQEIANCPTTICDTRIFGGLPICFHPIPKKLIDSIPSPSTKPGLRNPCCATWSMVHLSKILSAPFPSVETRSNLHVSTRQLFWGQRAHPGPPLAKNLAPTFCRSLRKKSGMQDGP